MSDVRLVCPECLTDENLWEEVEVPGWRCCYVTIENGRRESHEAHCGEREIEWFNARSSWVIHCGAEGEDHYWTGRIDQLVQLGDDGKPIPNVSKAQLNLDTRCQAPDLSA